MNYESMITTPYKNDECAQAFSKVLEEPTEDNISKAIVLAMPVLGKLLESHFRRLYKPGTEIFEEILSTSAMKLYEHLLSESFRNKFYNKPETHFSFLFGFFRYEVLNTVKRVKRSQKIYADDFSPSDNLIKPTQDRPEYKIFIEQLPVMIAEEVVKNIRFDGLTGELCRAIAKSLIAGKGIPSAVLRLKWDDNKSTCSKEFLINQARLAIRSVLWEIREQSGMTIDSNNYEWVMAAEILGLYREGFGAHSGKAEFWRGVDSSSDKSLIYYRHNGAHRHNQDDDY